MCGEGAAHRKEIDQEFVQNGARKELLCLIKNPQTSNVRLQTGENALNEIASAKVLEKLAKISRNICSEKIDEDNTP